jgi:DNA-3-methyladenine glycosylase
VILRRSYFQTDAESLAKKLLGQRLVRILPDRFRLAGLIVETEAYLGEPDAASHAYRLRRTPRNEAMYAPPGTSYVYFTYGMHFCFNIVCGKTNEPLAVLIRALEPTEGQETMRRNRLSARRPVRKSVPDTALCSGPARLCQALAIDRSLNGIDLTTDGRLFLEHASGPVADELVQRTPRIGVAYAGDWAARPLRFVIRGNPHISRKTVPKLAKFR